MYNRQYVLCFAIVVLLMTIGTAHATCGSSATCGEVTSSLVGIIVSDGIVHLSWTVTKESSEVDFYKIFRYDCSNPSTCSVAVATIDAVGACQVSTNYSHNDQPPGDPADWTYTLEVWGTNGRRACAIDTTPQ